MTKNTYEVLYDIAPIDETKRMGTMIHALAVHPFPKEDGLSVVRDCTSLDES